MLTSLHHKSDANSYCTDSMRQNEKQTQKLHHLMMANVLSELRLLKPLLHAMAQKLVCVTHTPFRLGMAATPALVVMKELSG